MFDLAEVADAIRRHGKVARVVIAAFEGSSPREVGAAMLIWPADKDWGQSGTIGGGALEWEATRQARQHLAEGAGEPVLTRHALGPALGQCCGGAVTLMTEILDEASLPTPDQGLFARGPGPMPLAVKRLLSRARGEGLLCPPQLVQGWFVEPLARTVEDIWIWGAGHVGRALVGVLAPLPGLQLTWVDTSPDRFPVSVPAGVATLPVSDPVRAVQLAPKGARHLILTYSHALDLALCHALLAQGFAHAGLIGSATKWARFRSRLSALGHAPQAIARIQCPIGSPELGKHPQAIAVGVAAEILAQRQAASQRRVG